jgi:hypothetical protein
MSRSGRKKGKLSAKNKMQQRANFAAAKNKLVGHIKETYIDPLRAEPTNIEKHKSKFGDWEGKVSTALGMAPSQNENRPPFEAEPTSPEAVNPPEVDPSVVRSSRYGAQSPTSRTEHFTIGVNENLPENVISMKDFKNKKMLRKPMGY